MFLNHVVVMHREQCLHIILIISDISETNSSISFLDTYHSLFSFFLFGDALVGLEEDALHEVEAGAEAVQDADGLFFFRQFHLLYGALHFLLLSILNVQGVLD